MPNRNERQWFFDRLKIKAVIRKNRKQIPKKVYVFLDFDGVVNVFVMPGTKKYKEVEESGKFEFFDRDCVANLNRLAKDYPLSIVVSSSWRFGGLDYCMEYLQDAGMEDHVRFDDVTSLEVMESREDLIADYLLEHQDFCGFVIFDDMTMPHLNEYLVQTNPLRGWDEERDRYARKIIDKFM